MLRLSRRPTRLPPPPRRAPSRRCRDAKVYGHTTTAMHDDEYTPPPPRPRFRWCGALTCCVVLAGDLLRDGAGVLPTGRNMHALDPVSAGRAPTSPYRTAPCHAVPYHTVPYHTIPYRTILYRAIPYHTIPCHTVPYHTIPHHTIPYHTILYHTIPYHTLPHRIKRMSCRGCVLFFIYSQCCIPGTK